jgi:hypothetical protein
MGNGLAQRQNASENLQRLAAQRRLYSLAKRLENLRLVTSVLLITALSIIRSLVELVGWNEPIALHVPLALSCIALAALLLENAIYGPISGLWRRRAADIQELFDCDVLQLEWNRVLVPDRPTTEDVHRLAAEYERHRKQLLDPYRPLWNWYDPALNNLPMEAARVIAQRTNCWWDRALRTNFIVLLMWLAGMSLVIVVIAGLIGDYSVRETLVFIGAPIVPLVSYLLNQVRSNKAAIRSRDRLLQLANESWRMLLAIEDQRGPESIHPRSVQDEILRNRRENPLIPDWYYQRRLKSQEAVASSSANEAIQEYLRAQEQR